MHFRRTNAPITSETQDMVQRNVIKL